MNLRRDMDIAAWPSETGLPGRLLPEAIPGGLLKRRVFLLLSPDHETLVACKPWFPDPRFES